MAALVGLDRAAIDRALERLRALGLLDLRPWSAGHPDGVWQLLPVPALAQPPRGGDAVSLSDLVRRLAAEEPPS